MSDRLAYQRSLTEIVKDSIPKGYQVVPELNDDLRQLRLREAVTVRSTSIGRLLSFTIFENEISIYGESHFYPIVTPFTIFETRELCRRVEDKAFILLNLHFPGLFEKPVIFDFKTWEEIDE